MTTLFKNIKELLQVQTVGKPFVAGVEMKTLPTIKDAYLLIREDKIMDFGVMKDCPKTSDRVVDVTGKMILPTWCDSHTHLVYAGN